MQFGDIGSVIAENIRDIFLIELQPSFIFVLKSDKSPLIHQLPFVSICFCVIAPDLKNKKRRSQ